MNKILDYLKKPVVAAVVGGILGLAIGLFIAWEVWPVQFKDADPSYLRADLQQEYLTMAIDSYIKSPNDALAKQRYDSLGAGGQAALNAIKAAGYPDQNGFANFQRAIQATSTEATPTPTPGAGKPVSSGTQIALIAGAIVVFAILGFLIYRYLIPLFRKTTSAEPTAAQRAREITSKAEMTDYAAMGEDQPISQFMTTYVLGDDLFDDSFSIDSPSGEFLGECGIGISEAIGVGEPKKVTAFEVWLFDKNDIQTVTKVLMSTHAFNDPAVFQRLQNKGEPVQIQRGKQVVLETAALQLVANITDIEYGQGALPEESYFERLTLEIAVWPKVTPPQ